MPVRQADLRMKKGLKIAAAILIPATVILSFVLRMRIAEAQEEAVHRAQVAAAEEQGLRAKVGELSATALLQQTRDPELGLLLAIESAEKARNLIINDRDEHRRVLDQVETSLRQSLMASRVRQRLEGNADEVRDVQYSPYPERPLIATAGKDGTVRIFDDSGIFKLAESPGNHPVLEAVRRAAQFRGIRADLGTRKATAGRCRWGSE